MKKITLLLLAVTISIATFAQSTTWSLDKAHAKLGFSITHLMVSDIEGSFKSFDAKIVTSKDDFSDATVELTADVNSINTENEQRDEHLRKPDFFDAAQYGTLTFKSKTFKKKEGNKYAVTGDLTLHGVTKPVEFEAVLKGPAIHPYTKKSISGFKVSGVIHRSDFGISPGSPSAMLSEEVAIFANAEFIKN